MRVHAHLGPITISGKVPPARRRVRSKNLIRGIFYAVLAVALFALALADYAVGTEQVFVGVVLGATMGVVATICAIADLSKATFIELY
ncbi:hypothetical protein ACTI_45540 [Actinoplanes sp. OR16]|uniref:hypothetical protein n=1 Tax=Actinoplanes sp. OR16 TaxID=946334 RepID=UPI000F712351|nr:hypothetical protein [Actinoplanes sp. OR16]BBH67869.1 hypothetical protein ACTI_45540 [Actinoplanes sp. OR16]